MPSSTDTVLRVNEVFHFASGVVVVVGAAIGEDKIARPGIIASVWVRGERVGTVEVLGERMPGRHTPSLRSVETRGEVVWDKAAIEAGDYELRW